MSLARSLSLKQNTAKDSERQREAGKDSERQQEAGKDSEKRRGVVKTVYCINYLRNILLALSYALNGKSLHDYWRYSMRLALLIILVCVLSQSEISCGR